MKLQELFDIQRELDQRIIEKHGLQGDDLLPKKILALQVELGELANEARFWKFWSEDQELRTWHPNEKDVCESCKGEPIFIENGKIVGQCDDCDGCGVHFHNPLLEEYVDCLHFILSIGIEIGADKVFFEYTFDEIWESETKYMIDRYTLTEILSTLIEDCRWSMGTSGYWESFFEQFADLGKKLGFSKDEVFEAYFNKHQINITRQETGY